MANEFHMGSKAFRAGMSQTAERITGTRWCGFGKHFTDPVDGVWFKRRHFRLFCCVRCLAQRKKVKAVTT